MKKYYFPQKFILGLYGYFRQIELSIHRALNDSWNKMLLFYKGKLPPERILEYFEKYCMNENLALNETIQEQIFLTAPQKILCIISKKIGGKPYLYEFEIRFFYIAIKRFSNIVSTRERPKNDPIVKLRMDLTHYCRMLSLRLSNNEIERSKLVEHFNQNNYNKFKSLERIVGEKWLDS